MEAFMTVAEKLGFPAACLVFVVLGLWIIIRWLGKNVVLPITNSHIDLIGKAKETNETNAQTLVKMANTSEVTGQAIVRIADQHEEGLKLTREIHRQLVRDDGIKTEDANALIRVENAQIRAANQGDQK